VFSPWIILQIALSNGFIQHMFWVRQMSWMLYALRSDKFYRRNQYNVLRARFWYTTMNSPIFEFSNLTFQFHNLFINRPFHICLPCSTVLLLEDGSGFCIFTIQNFEKVWGFALSLYESLRSYLLLVKKLRRVDQFSRVPI